MLSIYHFYIFATALLTTTILVPIVSHLSGKFGGFDAPDVRKIHTEPVPRLGGIAIFSGLLFTSLLFFPVDSAMKGLLVGAIVIFLTVAAKSVIMFVGFKLVLMRQIRRNRKIILAITLSLLIIGIRYLVSVLS